MSTMALDGAWEPTPADRLIVEAKRWGSRLRFAVLLLFYRARGRFPRAAEVDRRAAAELARARRAGARWRGGAAARLRRPHAQAATGRDPRPARLPRSDGLRRRG